DGKHGGSRGAQFAAQGFPEGDRARQDAADGRRALRPCGADPGGGVVAPPGGGGGGTGLALSRVSVGARRIAPERPEIARVVVKFRSVVSREPSRVAEDGYWCQLARRSLRRALRKPCGRLRVHVGVRRNENGLAGDAGPRIERLLEDRVAEDRDAHRMQNAPATLPEQLLPAKAAQHVE